MSMWGLYDTKDHLWLSTNEKGDGPKVFEGADAHLFAKAACRIAEIRARWNMGRVQPKEFHGQPTRLRNEVPLQGHYTQCAP